LVTLEKSPPLLGTLLGGELWPEAIKDPNNVMTGSNRENPECMFPSPIEKPQKWANQSAILLKLKEAWRDRFLPRQVGVMSTSERT
jgi:hypothetical protein